MPNTYTIITSSVLSSSTTSITFSAIPTTFTDLLLKMSVRSDQSGQPTSGLRMQFNGTNTASNTQLQGDGSGTSTARATGGSLQVLGTMNGPTSTTTTFFNPLISL